MARKKKTTEEQMEMFESGGAVQSQKSKADSAFAELDKKSKEMEEQGITSEFSSNGKKIVSFINQEAKDAYTTNDIIKKLRAGEITIEEAEKYLAEAKKAGKYAEGGMEDGGLKDEGGTVDPVSGNDVPSGSTQAEVRDDIPAQLSEGEFVFPADVVRYIGLENLMQLRAKAKQGLAKMESMGQMGNSDEATMDDDLEYNAEIDALIDNFDPNAPSTMEFAQGGVVKAANGYFAQPQQFSYGYMPPGFAAQQMPATGGITYRAPQIPRAQSFVTSPAQQAGAATQAQDTFEQRQYIGPNGELITIMFKNGVPQQKIPEGYKVYKPEEEKTEVAKPEVQRDTGGGAEERAAEEARQEGYDSFRDNMDTISKFDERFGDGKFSKEWNDSIHKSTGFSFGMLNIAGNIMDDFQRAKAADAVMAKVADKYGIDVDRFKQTGVSRFAPGEYDVDKFLAAVAGEPAFTIEKDSGLPQGFIDDNTYVDSEGSIRDVTAKSAGTKQALATEAAKPSTTPVGYDDSEDEASGRTSGTSFTEAATSGGYDDPAYADIEAADAPVDNSRSEDNDNTNASNENSPGGTYGVDEFSKGGAIQQTARALKSSRKKK